MKPGEIIAGRFAVDAFVAKGGMGDVYRATDQLSGRRVALKLIAIDHPAMIQRLAIEARALRELSHPAIVGYVAHETDPQRGMYLAMEWLEGCTLSERLRASPLSIDESLMLASRVADALGAAHARDVIHRDVKPLNLFLVDGRPDQVKVLDFGIARLTAQQHITATGIGMGTPEYMAPEQARCDRVIGSPADIFALGCVLYKCLTGKTAFRGPRVEAVLAKIAMLDQVPRVSELRPRVPPAVDDLCAHLMAFAPGDRPANGAEAATAIRATRDALRAGHAPPVSARPPPSLTRREIQPLSVIFAEPDAAEADTMSSEIFDFAPLAPPLGGASFDAQPEQPRELPDAASDTFATDPTLPQGHLATPAPFGRRPTGPRPTGPSLSGPSGTTRARTFERLRVMRGSSDIERLMPAIRAAVDPYGARVEVLLNGSIVALVTGGVAATDLAARSARVALAIRSILHDASVGVATARAVADERAALDPIIDAAAGLVRARSRVVRIDATTRALLSGRFAVDTDDAGGFVLGAERLPTGSGDEPARPVLGKLTPCVGRNRLLRQLEAVVAGCVEERASEAVVVVGEAGLGKSRVRAELVRRLRAERPGLWLLNAWGDALRDRVPYGLVSRLLRDALAVADGPLAEQQASVTRAVSELAADAAETRRLAAFLGELCGVLFDDADDSALRAARRDPQLMGDQLRRAFEDWLARAAQARPLVVIVDDLHWADQPSVELLGHALGGARDQPVALLAFGRPGLQDRFPSLAESWGRQEIPLDVLRPSDCAELVREVLGEGLAPGVLARVVERSAGNPFYLEELIRAAASGQTETLPESVLASVQLRLGRMAEDARHVLRAASVYGRVFWVAGVAELLGDDSSAEQVARWLTVLERAELVERLTESRLVGQQAYAFRHDLVREASHEMLTEADQRTGHRLAGEWLVNAGETDAVVLAEHFAGGGVADRAVAWFARAAEQALAGDGDGGDADAMAALRKAATFFRRAGETAARAYANDNAIGFFERSVALWAALDAVEAATTRLALAEVLERVGQRRAAIEQLEAADRTFASEPAAWPLFVSATLKRAQVEMVGDEQGSLEQALHLAHQAHRVASEHGDHRRVAESMALIAGILMNLGTDESRRTASRYADLAVALHAEHGASPASLWRLGNVFLLQNDLDRAGALYVDALAAAERERDEVLVASCLTNLGVIAYRRWDVATALVNTGRALDLYQRVGYRARETLARLNLGTFHYLQGDLARARVSLEDSLAQARNNWNAETNCIEALADLERHEGHELRAQQLLRRAIETSRRVQLHEKLALFLGYLAESLWTTGEVASAIACLEEAVTVGERMTLSHALVTVRMGQFDAAEAWLARLKDEESDPDRRMLASVWLARLRWQRGDHPSARELCQQTIAAMAETRIPRFLFPPVLLARCIDGDVAEAVRQLADAKQICSAHVFAELAADAGTALVSRATQADAPTIERYLELSRAIEDCGLRFRIEALRSRLFARLGQHAAAEAAATTARDAAEQFRSRLPDDYAAMAASHPWVVAMADLAGPGPGWSRS